MEEKPIDARDKVSWETYRDALFVPGVAFASFMLGFVVCLLVTAID